MASLWAPARGLNWNASFQRRLALVCRLIGTSYPKALSQTPIPLLLLFQAFVSIATLRSTSSNQANSCCSNPLLVVFRSQAGKGRIEPSSSRRRNLVYARPMVQFCRRETFRAPSPPGCQKQVLAHSIFLPCLLKPGSSNFLQK